MDLSLQNICNCVLMLTKDIKIADVPDPKRHPRKDIKKALTADLKRNVHDTFLKIEEYPNVKVFVIEYVQPCCNEKCPGCDYLKFFQLCLVLLRLLKIALTKKIDRIEHEPCEENAKVNASKAPLLSISHKKTLQRCLQFAVALGILPNLLKGIGIPLSKRLKHATILEHFTSKDTFYQKHMQIVVCLDTLIECLDCEEMQSTILTYHGTDILAALLQLCHAPIKKIQRDEASSEEPTATGEIIFKSMLTSVLDDTVTNETQIVNTMLAHREYLTPHLEKFLQRMCPSLLMWELILFKGINRKCQENNSVIKTPTWLEKICNQRLCDMILQSYGITRLVEAIIDKVFDSDILNGRIDSVNMDAWARLIAYLNVRHIPDAEYIEKIAKQVFQCLHSNNSPMANILKYVAACIILHFCARRIELAEQHFLVKLLDPLRSCVFCCFLPRGRQHIKVVKESVLTTCLEDLHQIFVICDSPVSRNFIRLIYPFSHCLCSMLFALMKGNQSLKSKMKNLISNIIAYSSDDEALSLLYALTFMHNKNEEHRVHITKVGFVDGDEGGIKTIKKKEEEQFSDAALRYHAVLNMLSEMNNKNLNRNYILMILKEFCNFYLESKDDAMEPKNIKAGTLFNVLFLEILEWDVDMGEALMSNILEVSEILMTLLDSICTCKTDTTLNEITIVIVLKILQSILESDDQLSTAEWEALKECLPSLQALQKSDIDTDRRKVIFSVTTHISTHGAACKNENDILANMANPANIGNTGLSADPECEQKPVSKNPKKDSRKKKKDSRKKKKNSRYDTALEEAKSPLVEIRGHGIIALGSLLRDRDQETMKNKKDLLKIFQENLEDDDTYVHLNAIKGLSLLGDIDAELVMPTVLEIFQKSEKFDLVLNSGQVLAKITESLGDIIHKYKDQLLHVFLIRTKHEDLQIRLSSLSNLAETCKKLGSNIDGHLVQEILMCAKSFLKTDPDIEIRQCAAMVIHYLLMGVGKDMIKVLENDMLSIYTQLKIVCSTESDDVLRQHAQLALEEIDINMKELLCAKVPLIKEIRILQ